MLNRLCNHLKPNALKQSLLHLFSCNPAADTAKPNKPTITRHPNDSPLTGPVVVDASQMFKLWCTAVNNDAPGTLQELHWRFPNDSHVPGVNRGETSNYDVYMVRYIGNSNTLKWTRVLHFNRVQLSFAGIYTCVASYSTINKTNSMEIQVPGGCSVKSNTHKWDDECMKVCSMSAKILAVLCFVHNDLWH